MTFPFSRLANYQALPSKFCMYMLADVHFVPTVLY
jgi:hypothetical protein